MRVAFINQPWNRVTHPAQSGSIAIWTYEVARRLAKSHEVIVYAKRSRDQKKIEWADGVQYRRIGLSPDLWARRIVRRVVPLRLRKPLWFGSAWFNFNYAFQISLDLRKMGCDVVHIHNLSQFAPIIHFLNPTSSVILHMHCEWLTQIRSDIIRRRLRNVDRIIGCSEFITDTVRQAFPERAASCRAIHNGVDIDRFRALGGRVAERSCEGPTILFVGRVSPEKGIHILIAAFRKVLERYPTARLSVVGPLGAAEKAFIVAGTSDPKVTQLGELFDGDYASRLKNELEPQLASHVEFRGNLSYPNLAREYGVADVFVYPSVWEEPFGLPVVEAMACGIPVVASRSGGLSEIVEDKVTGLLVERGDAAELAEALVTLLSASDLRERMGRAGRERVARLFSWEKVAGELGDLYEETRRAVRTRI